MPRPLKSYLLLMAINLGWNLASFALPGGQAGQNTVIDSLQNLLQTNIHDTTRINILNALGWELKFSNPDTSIILCNQALELGIEQGNSNDGALAEAGKKAQANSLRNLGVFNYLKGNYTGALENYHKALKINEGLKDYKGISATLGNIGIVYKNQGDYPKALEYYFKSLKMDEELGLKRSIVINLGNIGAVYYRQGDYPKALEYYFKALEMDEELGSKSQITMDLGNIGTIYNRQGDYPRALEYYFKALKFNEELNRKSGIATNLLNIGGVYSHLGDSIVAAGDTALAMADLPGRQAGKYPKALEYYFKSLKIMKEIRNKRGIAITLGNIGSHYAKTGKFKEAVQYLDSSLAICREIGALYYTKLYEENFSQLYDTLGNYKLAYEHYKKYSEAKDSLFNEEKSKDIGKLEAKHEYEMAEQERLRIEKERRALLAEAQHRRDNLQYSGILIFLVLVFAGVFALGRISIPIRLAEGLIFFAFLLFFEFSLVMLDPYIEQYSSGAPAIKLGFNAVLAGLIFPLHSFFESKLKKNLARHK